MIPPLVPSARDFRLLAGGGGDAGTVRSLIDGQFSRNVLLVRAVSQSAGDTGAGWLRPAYQLLSRVQRISPAHARDAIIGPGVGVWGTECLRGPVPPDAYGYLASVAAAAALRAGLDFEVDIPLTTVPGLGVAAVLPGAGTAVFGAGDMSAARVARRDGRATITAGTERIVVTPPSQSVSRGPAVPGWHPPPTLRASERGHVITVRLDDIDPYRASPGMRPASPTARGDLGRWQDRFAEAWRVLARYHPGHAEALAGGLRVLVPLTARSSNRSESATIRDAFGAVLLTQPDDGLHLALTLVHEFQHGKLSALENLVPLRVTETDADSQRFFAPWRDDPRPLGGLLQGAYAHLGVADFWRVIRHTARRGDDLPHVQFAWWRDSVEQALDQLDGCGSLSGHGTRFVSGMRATLDGWRAEPVPSDSRETSADLVLANGAVWRMRHLLPAAEVIDRLARSWLAGEARPAAHGPGGPDLRPGPRASPGADRLLHAAMTVARPGAAADGTLPPADADYAAGRHADALVGYRDELAANPDDPEAWAGLALSLRRLSGGRADEFRMAARDLLCDQPELARAVYLRILELRRLPECDASAARDSDPVALAAWLASEGPHAVACKRIL